jgi:hypothetical protein
MIHHLTNHRNGANIGYYNETGKRIFKIDLIYYCF